MARSWSVTRPSLGRRTSLRNEEVETRNVELVRSLAQDKEEKRSIRTKIWNGGQTWGAIPLAQS